MAEAVRKTQRGLAFLGQASIDGAIAALAARQHGVLALWQLVELGLTPSAVRARAASGRLHRIHQGVYSIVPRELLTRRGHWMAAALACGPEAVVSHRTAATLHGLLDYNGTKTDVTVPGPRARRRGNLIVHGSLTMTSADVTVVDNIPCTTIVRTLLDLGDVVERRRHERAFDQAEMMGDFDLWAIEDQLRRNPTRSAARKTRALLEEHYIGSTPTESELEELALALCRRITIPMPSVQRWLILPDGGPPLRPDFTWVEQRVILEADGDRFHGTRQAREERNLRDQRLMVHGWRPLHASARQLTRGSAELEATLTALVRRA